MNDPNMSGVFCQPHKEFSEDVLDLRTDRLVRKFAERLRPQEFAPFNAREPKPLAVDPVAVAQADTHEERGCVGRKERVTRFAHLRREVVPLTVALRREREKVVRQREFPRMIGCRELVGASPHHRLGLASARAERAGQVMLA